MPTTEQATIEQPVTRPTEQRSAQENNHAAPQPEPTMSTVQKMQSGKGMQRPRVRRIEGKNGTPTTRSEQPETKPSEQPTPTTEQVQTPVAKAEEVPVVEEKAATVVPEAKQPEGPRVLRPTNPDDMIEIPGEKPLSVNQLKADRGKMRQIDQKEGQLNYREQQIATRERELLERERNQQTTRPTQQFEPQPVIAEDRPPERPKDAIEGDDEWAAWQAKLIAYHVDKSVEKRFAPIAESIHQTKVDRDAETKARTEAQERFKRNDIVFSNALREHLPFDPIGLSNEVFDKVVDAVRNQAVALDERYDFRDNQKMASIDLDPAIAKAAIKLAFPQGSFPPGYTTTVENPMTKAAEEPLVPASPKKPLPNTIADSVPSKQMTAKTPPGAKAPWYERIRSGSLEPVTVRRTG